MARLFLACLALLLPLASGYTHPGALGNSTPFLLFNNTAFASLSAVSTVGNLTESVCMKKCEDDPNCAAFSLVAGACIVNTNDRFTVRALSGAALYRKMYRVKTITSPTALTIKSKHDLLCIENPVTSVHDRVSTYECDDHTHRSWTMPRLASYIDMRYRLFHLTSGADGRCLEASSEADPSLVELRTCDNTSAHSNVYQRWQLLESNQLRNERTGRCLDLDAQKVITLQPCNNVSDTQHWWVRVNSAGRMQYDATAIDEVNIGDQRQRYNAHLNTPASELQCTDC